ncbi:MAG: sulfatase-like hydrolase/transferase, partial [Planctomycetota bacterium]
MHRFLAPLLWLALAGTVSAQGNVLLVVLDDVGVDRVAVYEAVDDPPATPVMDRLAREGVRFDRCWSNPLCSPTRATVITGRYSFRTGVGSLLGELDEGLSTEEWTLPRVLRAATEGTTVTAAIGKWHLGASDEDLEHPRRAGFEHYAGCLNNLRNREDPRAYYQWTKVVDGEASEVEGYLTTDTTDDALRAIAAAGERPWFVYLAYHAAHNPLHEPPAGLFERELEGTALTHPAELHKAMVEALDHELGRLLEGVDPKVLARTTILVVGDNGTQGSANEPPWDNRRGKGTLFEGGIHVPLIVSGAGVGERARGSVCDAPVNTTDLWATTLELCGVDVEATLPAGWVHDSVSILPF